MKQKWDNAPSDYAEKLELKDFAVGGTWWLVLFLAFLCAAALVTGCGREPGQERAKFGGNSYTRIDAEQAPCVREEGTMNLTTPDKADPCPKHEITDLPKLCEITLAGGKQVVFTEPAQVQVKLPGVTLSYYYLGVKLIVPLNGTWLRVDRVENDTNVEATFMARRPE